MLMLRGTQFSPRMAGARLIALIVVYAIYTRSQKIWWILMTGFVVELLVMGISLVFM